MRDVVMSAPKVSFQQQKRAGNSLVSKKKCLVCSLTGRKLESYFYSALVSMKDRWDHLFIPIGNTFQNHFSISILKMNQSANRNRCYFLIKLLST